jgi:5-methyltetrahydrofolate--homocysteine methyltransferase
VRGVPIDEIVPLINEVALFRNQWGFTPGDLGPDGYRELLEREARPVLRDLVARAKAERIVTPVGRLRLLPGERRRGRRRRVGPGGAARARARALHFPRQDRGRFLCIADFLRSVDGGVPDVLGVQVVTMGSRITEVAADCSRGPLPGLPLHARLRRRDGRGARGAVAPPHPRGARHRRRGRPTPQDWFRQGYRGSRYSFGYPACPNLEDQELLFQLVDPTPIGVSLTDEFMLHPEQSTSAIVLHHPEATLLQRRERDEADRPLKWGPP